MTAEFAPKSEEVLRTEITTELGVEYEGNEEMVDKLVARELKDEAFKASLHEDKKKHLEGKRAYEERLKKAGLDPETGEKLQKIVEPVVAPKNEVDLSAKDVVALRDVHEEDIDYLLEESKLRGVSISELKKNPYTQIILKTRAEERKTAEAANTSSTRRSSSKTSADSALEKVNKQEDLTEEEAKIAAKALIAGMKSRGK